MRDRLPLVAALIACVVLVGCQSDSALPHPAAGPPDLDPPRRISEAMEVGEDKVTDTREHMTGVCASLYLWSETDADPDWRIVAQNETVITDRDPAEVFCPAVGVRAPYSYPLPLSELPGGWYSACSSEDCTPPFENETR